MAPRQTIRSVLGEAPEAELIGLRLGDGEVFFFEAERCLNEYFGLCLTAHMRTLPLTLGPHTISARLSVDGSSAVGEPLVLDIDMLITGFAGVWESAHPISKIFPARMCDAYLVPVKGIMSESLSAYLAGLAVRGA